MVNALRIDQGWLK